MSEPALPPQAATTHRPKLVATFARRWICKWLYAWLAVVIGLTTFILVARHQAVDRDHASANLNTYICCLLLWIVTLFFLLISRLWKLSLAIGLVPVLATLVFIALNRLERVDGELRPHFVWRWSAGPDLPFVLCLQLTTGKEIWTQDLNKLANVDQAKLLEEVK